MLATRRTASRAFSRYLSTLVVAEPSKSGINPATLSAITAARKLGQDVSVLVLGHNTADSSKSLAALQGVKSVFECNNAALENPTADVAADTLLALQQQQKFTHIVSAVSSFSRDVLPRVGAKLDVQPVTDVIDIKSADTFVRPTYAGNALATVRSKDSVKVLGVRPTAFPPAGAKATQPTPAGVSATPLGEGGAGGAQWVREEVQVSDKPQLANAKTVVSGGRALKSQDNFNGILGPLCDKLGAAMGASRAAVDSGMAPNDMQVGQTGKVVAPDLYVAVGISGAIQHLAGMKDSRTIVAINKDPDAPIFQVADYGLVGDLFEAVPELTKKLNQQKAN